MDIFDSAMQMEKENEAYYRQIAETCRNDGLSKILNMLADDEVKYYNVFKSLKESEDFDFTDTQILTDAKNVFAHIKQSMEDFDPNISQVKIYEKAQELEKKSEDFYMEKSEEINDEKHKDILFKIAGEKRKHYLLLENIIEFVRKPDIWIENDEFSHLDEY